MDPERKVEFTIQEKIIVNGDAHLLQIVLENLLGNDWKFTAGRSDAKIEFDMTVEKGKRVCYVKGSPKNKFTFSGVDAPVWQGARRANSRAI